MQADKLDGAGYLKLLSINQKKNHFSIKLSQSISESIDQSTDHKWWISARLDISLERAT